MKDVLLDVIVSTGVDLMLRLDADDSLGLGLVALLVCICVDMLGILIVFLKHHGVLSGVVKDIGNPASIAAKTNRVAL